MRASERGERNISTKARSLSARARRDLSLSDAQAAATGSSHTHTHTHTARRRGCAVAAGAINRRVCVCLAFLYEVQGNLLREWERASESKRAGEQLFCQGWLA